MRGYVVPKAMIGLLAKVPLFELVSVLDARYS